MGTMSVSLPDDLVAFVQDEAASGGYGNQSDVVREGLRLLRERKQKAAALLAALEKGHTDALAGRTKPLTDERLRGIADRAKARGRKRRGLD
jgi:antitoxin ParD1/3/4